MSVALEGKKRNVSQLSAAELEGDIDYLLHVEHDLPMELYTQLDPLKSDLAQLIVTHADAAVRRAMQDMRYRVAERLRDVASEAIMAMPLFIDEATELTPKQVEAVNEVKMKDLLA